MQLPVELQLDALFDFEQQLQALLDGEQYELFQQQQDLFSDQIKALLDTNSSEDLAVVVEQLKILEAKIAALQIKSDTCYQQLKEKSLLQKRNKSKIKAYK
ncbi:hypothetical protein [Psychromonas ossibalaenae]|uniref:hypothetical protein n=1 Tax=Psychromonas ossibalaenae TaxID=444922 RepID=UPI00036CEE83|nr:hypothetical protein [Psychromonas ossibalaenae]